VLKPANGLIRYIDKYFAVGVGLTNPRHSRVLLDPPSP
jgi:hypothetical protein